MTARPLLLPLFAAAALALSACDGTDPFAPTATVDLPADAAIAGTDPAGRLVLLGGGETGATATVVAGDAVVSSTEVALPDRSSVVLAGESEVLFGELTDGGFLLHVADARTGAPLGDRPVVPFPEDADVTTTAIATPDGRLLIAVSRVYGTPELLLVDPATGAVTGSAAVDLSGIVDPARLADSSQLVEIKGVVASPAGSAFAVALDVYDDVADRHTGVLTVVDRQLAPVTAPFVPAPGEGWGTEPAVWVADDGTATAAVEQDGEDVLAAVDPGAGDADVVAHLTGSTHTLVVTGGVVWLVYDDDPLRVTRIDLASGGTTHSVDLCSSGGTAQLVPADDGGVWLSDGCDADRLWRFTAEPTSASGHGAGR